MNESDLYRSRLIDPNSTEPINRQIYKILKRKIIECRLMPDESISENTVANRFDLGVNVSRQPIREALIKLAENDFVIIQPKKTTRVSRISRSDIMQGAEIRKVLESHIIRKTAEVIDDATLQMLEKNVTSQRFVAEQYNLHEHFKLDDDFHHTMLTVAGMEKAWDIVERFKGVMDRVRYLALDYELTPMATTSDSHRIILEALKAHDADAASKAMYNHIDETLQSLKKAMEKCKPDWFVD